MQSTGQDTSFPHASDVRLYVREHLLRLPLGLGLGIAKGTRTFGVGFHDRELSVCAGLDVNVPFRHDATLTETDASVETITG
jgi:hypothetical protein